MNEIRDGDVLTFAGNWPISRVIKWWTGQSVSHVGIALWLRFGEETQDRLCVLESMEPGGIRIVPLTVAVADSSEVYWQRLDVSQVSPSETIGWALQQWGRSYASWLQVLSHVSPIFGWLHRRFRGPLKGYHCSELVAEALSFGGFALPKPAALVTPGDLWTFACLHEPIQLTVRGR